MGKFFDAIQVHEKTDAILPERIPVLKSNETMGSDAGQKFKRDSAFSPGVNPKLFAYTEPDSIDAEVFNMIKGRILFPKDGHRRRTIMITSAFPGEGKTLVAANLAVALAMGAHETVLLVDCDLRRPKIHQYFGCRNEEGLHEYLAGKRVLKDLLIRTKIQKLMLLTAGKAARRPADLLASSMMKDLLASMMDESEDLFVVLDGTPCHYMAEASVLANYVDGIVFVIMAKGSPRQAIKKSTESFGKDKILGIVFNGYSKAYKSYHRYYKRYYKKEVSNLPVTP